MRKTNKELPREEKLYQAVMLKNIEGDPVSDFISEFEKVLNRMQEIAPEDRLLKSFTSGFGVWDGMKEWLSEQKEAADRFYKVLTEADKEFDDVKEKLEDLEIAMNDMEEKKKEIIEKLNELDTEEFRKVKIQIEELASTVYESI